MRAGSQGGEGGGVDEQLGAAMQLITRSLYDHPALYRLAMRLSYRREYPERYELLADQIASPGDVLELCCGDLALHDSLRDRGLVKSYRGLDLNPGMLIRARRRGVDVRSVDVRRLDPLPSADVVV